MEQLEWEDLRRYTEKKLKMKNRTQSEKYKLLWMWIKTGDVNLKVFKALSAYIASNQK
jgi:hypothetical protein